MSRSSQTLADRRSEQTRNAIVEAAVDLLTESSFDALSAKAIGTRAGISERTVFRYYGERAELLRAIAGAITERLQLPPAPETLADLLAYAGKAFAQFEQFKPLIKAALHTEVYPFVRADRQRYGTAIAALVAELAPSQPEARRRRAAANIHYHLIASTWHYYRFILGHSYDETVACSEEVIRDVLLALGVQP